MKNADAQVKKDLDISKMSNHLLGSQLYNINSPSSLKHSQTGQQAHIAGLQWGQHYGIASKAIIFNCSIQFRHQFKPWLLRSDPALG